MWYVVVGIAAACLVHAQQHPSTDVLLLKIKAKMEENLGRLPDYTCAETTQRFRRVNSNGAYEPLDTVRLEVALVEGRELYGWRGSNRIAEPDPRRLVGGGGALSNGNFALLAKGIFLSPATSFTPKGVSVRGHVRSLKFDYDVPVKASDYHLRVGEDEAIVGYHGSFWVNPDTLDLERVEILADHIPPEFPLVSASDAMEYSRVRIGASDFLLPSTAELRMVTASGLADRNRTRFHECHQYSGESVLSFEVPPEMPAAPARVPPQELTLPGDFQIDLALQTPITASSAVGDPVEARLVRSIKEHHRVVMVKGATAIGRITQLHRDAGRHHLGITFTDLVGRDGHADLSRRQNVLLAGASWRDLPDLQMLSGMEHGFRQKGLLAPGQLTIPGDKPLKLYPGFRLTLRSRLLQSGK